MGRSVIMLCAAAGATVGGFVPDLWGGSSMSLASLAFAGIGGVAGIWFGARISSI